jgi:hypothetical protein
MATKVSLADRAGYALLLSLGLHVGAGSLVGRGATDIGWDAAGVHARALEVRLAPLPATPIPLTALPAIEVRPPEEPPSVPRQASTSARSAALVLGAPYYFPASELDRRPHPVTAIELQDPAGEAADGYLILKLLINESGTVDDALVVVNDGGDAFASEAAAAFRRARYAPGVKAGRAVKSQMMIEVKLARAPG